MSEEIRKTGIDIIGGVPWGTHFCQFYRKKKDLTDILVPYFKAGLENNEFCMWITSKPLSEKDAAKALAKVLPDLDLYLKKGQIEIIPHDRLYLKNGSFSSKRVLKECLRKLDNALSKGYDGLRLTGNTFWLEKKDWKNFTDYEREVNKVIGNYRIIALCTYSLDRCKANEVVDVLQTHQFALIMREGKLEFIESFGHKRAENEMKRFASFPQLNPNPVLEVNSSGIIVFCNAAAIQTLRKLNLRDTTMFLPDDIRNIVSALKLKNETQFYREVTIKDRIFGEALYLTPQFDSVRIYANDITERKSYQKALQNALQESRQREAEISALLEGSSAVLKYSDFESAARAIYDSCKKVIGATSGYIAMVSKDGKENEVLFLDSGGLSCTVDPTLPMPIRGLRGVSYHNVKTVYENDFAQSEWVKFLPEGHSKLKNVLFAPLVLEGKAIGLLGLANKSGGFTENDARMASAFAELAAIVFSRVRSNEALRHSEEYFRLLTENASDVITILDADGIIRYESPSVEEVIGYKQEELIGKSAFKLIHPDDLPDVMNIFSHGIKNPGIVLSAQFRCKHRDGSWRFLDLIGKNLLDNPAVSGIVINSRDITESRQAEEALHYERQKLINIMDSMVDGIYIVNQQYDIEYINPELEKEYGPVNGRQCYEYFEGQKKVCSWCKNQEVFGDKIVRWEWYSTKTKKTYDLINTPLRNPDGGVSKLGIFRDITERKRAEEALRESEERLRLAQQVARVGTFEWNIQTGVNRWTSELEEMYGLEQGGFAKTQPAWEQLVHPDDQAEAVRRVEQSFETEKPTEGEWRVVWPDGSVHWLAGRWQVFKDEAGKPLRMTGVNIDITERKKKEDELLKLNRTLRALSNSNQAMLHAETESDLLREICSIIVQDCGHAMVWIGFAEDNEGKTVRPVASAGFEKGYLETLNITWADTERGRGPTGTAIRTGRPSICRNMLTDPAFEPWRKEATKRGYASSIVLPLMADSRAYGTINIYSREPDPFTEDEVKLLSELTGDLSYGILAMRSQVAHAEAQEAVLQSEKRYRSLFNNMTEGFAIHEIITDYAGTSIDYRFLDINPSFERLTGLVRDNVLGKTVKEVIPEIESNWIETYGRVALTGEPSHFVSYSAALDKHYEVFAYCNAPRQFAVIFMDITQHKQAEEGLRESRQDLDRAQEVGQIGSWRLDVLRNVLTWSDENHRIFGVPKGTPMTYETFLSIVHPDDREYVDTKWKAGLAGENYDIEHRIVVDGKTKWVRERAYLEFDKNGELLGGFGITQDITERKRMEAELRRSRDELEIRVQERTAELRKAYTEIEAFFESSITPVVFLDRDFNFIRVNEAYAKCCARDISEFEGHNHFEFYPHEENEAIFRQVVETKTTYQAFAKAFSFPDHPEWGVTYWDWTLTPILDFSGEVDFLVFALNDVTERKQAENELQEHERLLTTVLDILPVGVWTLDREGNIVQGNPAGEEIWRGSRYVGINEFGQYKGWWMDTGKLIEPEEWGAARAIQKGETSLNEEIEIECFDGTHKIILHSAIPLFDDERNITGAVVVNQDITNRKKAEETIRAERQRFYSVLEKLPAYVCLLTPDYTFAYVNQEFKNLFGDPGDRQCYEYLFNCQGPCEGCQTYKIFTEHKDEQQWEWVGPNGNTYAIYDHAFSDIDGTPLILEMGLDITDRKKALERLSVTGKLLEFFITKSRRKEYLDSVVDLLHEWTECNCIGIRILDKQGNIPYESYTGFSREFWESENWISVKNHQCACTRVVLQKPDPQDMSMMTTNGSFRCDNTEEFAGSLTEKELTRYRGVCILTGFKSVAIIPIHYKENIVGAIHIADKREGMVPLEMIEFIESVSPMIGEAVSRFSAEEALEKSEERYRMLVDTMNEGLEMDDENGLLVYANDRLCEMLGYSRDEIIGRPILSFFDEKTQNILREQIERRKSGESEPYRLEWVKKDGQKIITLISPRGIFDASGEYRGSFAVITDITEKLRLESIAQAVNTMKNIGFIFSGIRHEIGNPVNSIKMALSVLKQNIDSYSKDTVKEYADRMLSEILRMEYLLKAMKNFNMYETLELMDVNMTSFMDKFLSLVTSDIAKKGIKIGTDIPETLWAYADPRALQQVLLNIMTNASDALEGRENPKITVSVLKMAGMVNIRVEDNGFGMSEDQQEDLFKPFYTNKAKGTGLGLVIAKKMMAKMNGVIEVVSEKNRGTIVDLFIPEGINEEV